MAKIPTPSTADAGVKLPAGIPLIDIARVIPYARNARTHSDRQVAEIAGSIKEFGFKMPIGVSFEAGSLAPDSPVKLWAGHGRILAAQKLGMKVVPFVDWSDLTDIQQRALALADNKIALNAGWDDNLLGLELAELKGLGADIDALGFNEAEIQGLLVPPPTEGDDAATGELPAVPIAQPGDQWTLGQHVVRCGDATNPVDVMQLLGVEKPNLMVTDPPYGVNYNPMWRDNLKRENGTRTKVKAGAAVNNDDEADWSAAYKLFPGDVAYVWHGDSKGSGVVEQSLKVANFGVRATIIWNKMRLYIGRGHYQAQHEPCFYLVRIGKTGNWHGDRKQSTVWDIPVPKGWEQERDEGGGDEHTKHSTQKPVLCMERPMLNNSNKGDAVYDPFGGSGTTIIAGERSGRRVFMMEIDPVFVDIIIQRWEKETKGKAMLDGKTYDEVRLARVGNLPVAPLKST